MYVRHTTGDIACNVPDYLLDLTAASTDALYHCVDHIGHVGVEVSQRAFIRLGEVQE